MSLSEARTKSPREQISPWWEGGTYYPLSFEALDTGNLQKKSKDLVDKADPIGQFLIQCGNSSSTSDSAVTQQMDFGSLRSSCPFPPSPSLWPLVLAPIQHPISFVVHSVNIRFLSDFVEDWKKWISASSITFQIHRILYAWRDLWISSGPIPYSCKLFWQNSHCHTLSGQMLN